MDPDDDRNGHSTVVSYAFTIKTAEGLDYHISHGVMNVGRERTESMAKELLASSDRAVAYTRDVLSR